MSSAKTCPRCHARLRPASSTQLSASACDACGGVWLDNQNAQLLVSALDTAVAELSRTLALSATVPPWAVHKDLRCPDCKARLAPRAVTLAEVVIDICEAHGTWFDAGELERVQLAVRGIAPPPDPAKEAERARMKQQIADDSLKQEVEKWNQETSLVSQLMGRIDGRQARKHAWMFLF